MHEAVNEWVGRFASDDPVAGLDIGGRNINGHPRENFPNAKWTVLDISPGEGVDIVADAAAWTPDRIYELVLCTEVFEHVENWRDILKTAASALIEGGRVIVTCAGPGRHVHSGIDGELRLLDGEWYANIGPSEMMAALVDAGFTSILIDQQGLDVRASATRR